MTAEEITRIVSMIRSANGRGHEGEEAGEESVPDRELVKASAEAVTEHAEGRKKGFFSAAETAPATPGSVKGKSGRGKRAGLA